MTNGFKVPSETVEAGLLHAVVNMQQWLELAIFTEDDFTQHRAIFQFFRSHLTQYGTLPTQNQISTKFDWKPPIGEFRYWLDEMKRYSLARKVLLSIQDGYEKVKSEDPDKALSSMLTSLSLIRSSQSNHVKATDAGANERLEKFDARTENIFKEHKLIGVRTGLKIIDNTQVGYIPGSLVGCYARPHLGKTWWALWSGMNAWYDGLTVLVIAPEMPANLLNLRIDTLAGFAIGHPIEYNKLIIGDPSIRAEYNLITQVLSQSSRWWTYDSIDNHAIGLGDIAALINQHKPDIVIIDGISLLRADNRGQTWEQIKDMIYGLKDLATIKEVPILVTHQAVNSGRGRRGMADAEGRSTPSNDEFLMPSLNDAAFGDAFVQACSDVITMCGEPNSQHILWYSIRKHRERGWQQPLESRYALAVDFGLGKLIDLSEHGYNPGKVGQETQRLLGHL